MCRKWYPLETKDVNKEFLDDIESDREASNGDSTDIDWGWKCCRNGWWGSISSSSWRFFYMKGINFERS